MDLLASVGEEHGTVGSQLKAGRERLGLSLSDIAAQTRVPTRHLESIEQSDYGALPGQTYTLGFARSYANAVDMDAAAISYALRLELARSGLDISRNRGGCAGCIFNLQKPDAHRCCASRETGHFTGLSKASRHGADRASVGK